MLDKRTFCKFLNILEEHTVGVDTLEQALKVTFDNNFLTQILDKSLDIIAESFFTEEQLEDLDYQTQVETVKDMLYHYAFAGEFGLKTGNLQRLYVEDEGLKTEFALNAFNAEELYTVIDQYLNPPTVAKTYLINC